MFAVGVSLTSLNHETMVTFLPFLGYLLQKTQAKGELTYLVY